MDCAYCGLTDSITRYIICPICYKNFARSKYHPVANWRPLSPGWMLGLWANGAYVVRNNKCLQLNPRINPYTQYVDQEQEQFVVQVINAEAKCPFDYIFGRRGRAFYYKNPSPEYQHAVESWTNDLAIDVIRYIRARQYRARITPESNLSRPPASWHFKRSIWLPKVKEWLEDKKLECLMAAV